MKCRTENVYVMTLNAESNTSVSIHRVSASNMYVFTREVNTGVDPPLGIIIFVNHTNAVILELVVCRQLKLIQVIYPDAHKHLTTARKASSVEDVKSNTFGKALTQLNLHL